MVANAGIFLLKPLLDTSVEEWERMLAINGKGVFLSIKHAAKKMIEQGRGGRIICALWRCAVGSHMTRLRIFVAESRAQVRPLSLE